MIVLEFMGRSWSDARSSFHIPRTGVRALGTARPARTVLFVASSGHELGHLGINAYVDRRQGIVPNTVGWMHFGASIGAAMNPGNTLQSSDDEMDAVLTRAMTAAGLNVDRRVPRGTVPNGEAEAVHRGGGRYVSIIGRNALFHNPDDRGPRAVDIAAIAKFSKAFVGVAMDLAASLVRLRDLALRKRRPLLPL